MHVQRRFDEILGADCRSDLLRHLCDYIPARRWFRSKSRSIDHVTLEHARVLPTRTDCAFVVARVHFASASRDFEDYVVPLTWREGDAGARVTQSHPELVIGEVDVKGEERPRWLIDALGDSVALTELVLLANRTSATRSTNGDLHFRKIVSFDPPESVTAVPLHAEQSNTSVVFPGLCILKIFRRLEPGTPADLEMGEFLTRVGYRHAPPLLAAIEWTLGDDTTYTIGLAHALVSNQGDAWTAALAGISRGESPVRSCSLLSKRVAQLHEALASDDVDPRFSPEPIAPAERAALADTVRVSLARARSTFEARISTAGAPPARSRESDATDDVAVGLSKIGKLGATIDAVCEDYVRFTGRCMKTRVHGDLHLGQVLVTGDDYSIIDFEGEPARSLSERKAKRSPLVDVAGMLRSLHYASVAGEAPSAAQWHAAAARAFSDAYFEHATMARNVLPQRREERDCLLRFHLLEKAVYELHYELNNRPDWVRLPIEGILAVLGAQHER